MHPPVSRHFWCEPFWCTMVASGSRARILPTTSRAVRGTVNWLDGYVKQIDSSVVHQFQRPRA